MEGIDVPFDKVQELSGDQIYAHIKRNFLKAKGADAIYMLGSGWRTLDIIATLEQDLQVPVVHPVTARVWEIQKRLHVREPRRGFGHLLADLAVSETSHGRSATHSGGHSALGLVLRAAGGRRTSGSAIGRAILQGPHRHDAGRHRAGRHQRHLGAPRRRDISAASFRAIRPSSCRTIRAPAASSPPTGSISIAEKDGSVLAKLERAVPQLAIQGNPNAQFDPQKFTWLGSLSSYADDAYLMTGHRRHPAKTIDDLNTPGMAVTLGADNAASSNLIFAVIAKEVLGLNVNWCAAIPARPRRSSSPCSAARSTARWSGLQLDPGPASASSGMDKAFRPLLQFGRTTRHPDFRTCRPAASSPRIPSALGAAWNSPSCRSSWRCRSPRRPDIPADRAKALQTRLHGDVPGQGVPRRSREARHRHQPDRRRRDLDVCWRATAATPKDVIARYNAIGGERK